MCLSHQCGKVRAILQRSLMRTDHFWEPLLTLLFLSLSLLFFLPLKTSPESPRNYFKPAHPRMTALPLPMMLWRIDIEMRQLHHSVVPKAGRLTCWLSCSVRSESLSACSLLCFCFLLLCFLFSSFRQDKLCSRFLSVWGSLSSHFSRSPSL